MKKIPFTGSGVALVTPFNENGIDFKVLEELIEFQIKEGTDAIIICGTTGETSTMSPEEHKETIRFAIEGNMVEKDSLKALHCYRLSAEQENTLGMYRYAIAMESNTQYSADKNEILSYMGKAAQQGLHDAMIYMMNYEHEQHNYKAAYSWARKLSLEENHVGTTYVADCYLEGRAVGRDKRLAKDLYRQAAYAGNREAAEKLRNMK